VAALSMVKTWSMSSYADTDDAIMMAATTTRMTDDERKNHRRRRRGDAVLEMDMVLMLVRDSRLSAS
jgi:hypothetical protein